MAEKDNRKDVAQAFLEVSEADWEELVARKIAQHLIHIIPVAVEYQDNLEDAKKFFVEVKELSVPPKIDKQLDLLDNVRMGIVATVQDSKLESFEISSLLDEALSDLKEAFTKYAKLESDTVFTMRSKSKRLPKEAFIEKVRSYWNYVDDFWPSEREAIIGKWNKYFEETNPILLRSGDHLKVNTVSSPHGVLIRVSDLLKKRSAHFTAQKAEDSLDRIKNYYIEEQGLIPSYMGAKGNWKVEKDDCPDKRLPEKNTKLSERFAFCRIGEKKCPSFQWSQGSYVKCKSFVRLKEASLIDGIKVLSDKDYIGQLRTIAETDPFVRMLFVESERRSGELFYGKVIDERLETMLGQYPTSNRKGQFKYRVYMVSNEPVLVSGKYAVAADKVLLETIGEGERMPKHASTIRIAGPVMRVTFTANALRDPEFRDFLRKKDAVKAKHSTYDIPFEREEEIGFFLSEVRDEFGYKIEIFQIMEDADESVAKDFGVYRFSDLPLSRFSSFRLALSYIPAVKGPHGDIVGNVRSMEGADKLVDVANNLPDNHPLKNKVAGIADRLRVGAHILIASKDDIIRYADGAIGLVPEPGSRWVERDPDSGDSTVVELVEVNRHKQGAAPTYKVRRLDTGKEIEIKRPWIRPVSKDACDGPMVPPMAPPPAQGPAVPPFAAPPEMPFGHIIGEDDVFYIVQVPKGPPADFTPPPFGRFPGDEPPLPIVPPPPPPASPPGVPLLPFPSAGGDSNLGTPPVNGMPPALDKGPIVETEKVFVVEDSNPENDFSEDELLEDISKKINPRIKFMNPPEKGSPGPKQGPATDDEVDEAVEKLRTMFRGDPRVKNIRRDLSPKGKPLLYLHSTMPKSMKDEVPNSINGFEVIVSPLHDSMLGDKEESKDKQGSPVPPNEPSDVNADSLVNPMPNRPENGKSKGREHPPGPYLDQVSEPPTMNDQLVTQIRDIPKGR